MPNAIKRRTLVLSLGVALPTLALSSTARAQDDRPYVPVIVKDNSTYYWKIVLAGAVAAGTELGAKVEGFGPESEQDVAGQIALLEKAVADGAAAVVIAPSEYDLLGPEVDKAARSVPIIVIDSRVNSLNMRSTLTTDNVAAGALAADGLVKAMGAASGEVAIVNLIKGSGSLIDRSKGFKDQLFAAYPEIAVVEETFGDGSVPSIETSVAGILDKHPDLRGIFASNIHASEVAAMAVKAAGRGDRIKILGFDSSDTLVKALADGDISGLIVQDPYRMGYEGVKAAYAALAGQGVLQTVDTGATLVTKENMNGDREQALLNPVVE